MKLLSPSVCGGLLAACATSTKAPTASQFAEDSLYYGEPGIYFAENPGETKVMYADTNAFLLSVDDRPYYFLVRTSWDYNSMPVSIAEQTDSLQIMVLSPGYDQREMSISSIDVPTWVSKFPYLQKLSMETMQVSGKSFKRILSLHDLKEISFSEVTIKNIDYSIKYLRRLPSLERIKIFANDSSEVYNLFESALPNVVVLSDSLL